VAHRFLIAAVGPVGCYLVAGALMALGNEPTLQGLLA
jgi:hypothetical protein